VGTLTVAVNGLLSHAGATVVAELASWLPLTGGRLDARRLALPAALTALDIAARALVTGVGRFSPIFLLILCGGYVLDAEHGFFLGAATAVARPGTTSVRTGAA
jgi:hypothetical protein